MSVLGELGVIILIYVYGFLFFQFMFEAMDRSIERRKVSQQKYREEYMKAWGTYVGEWEDMRTLKNK